MINLKSLPSNPGIYIYRNRAGDIIYVGKAINLKKRVSQYFSRDDALGIKTSQLVSQIASVETKVVGSEIEALILEASYIKKYHPKYNSQLKDDRSYLYICISTELIPRIFTSHQSNLPPKAEIYGPFPDGASVKSLLKIIRRIFPFRSLEKHPTGDCLYCHLGLCPGAKPDLHIYKKSISHIKQILSGRFTYLQKNLRREMALASKSQNYELAVSLRDQLTNLEYVVSGWSNLSHLYQQIDLPEDQQSSAINELSSTLKIPLINRIECFDISQLGTKYFVGSMTVWQNGHLDNSQYRKFKILYKASPDDQLMIKEIVYRRLKHPEWGTPDLIVVDGGKPQVTAAETVVSKIYDLRSKISVLGLAKKLETIVIKNGDSWQEINLPHHSTALRLLQQLRDEAHRFANRYRKELISKQWIN
ncbi:MAG: GIY-YIG nuclease family protein [Candidatus Shapirobacteria bacterium]|jgi:excinuclease ABC subunit C